MLPSLGGVVASIRMVVSPVQPENSENQIFVKLDGKVILSSPLSENT